MTQIPEKQFGNWRLQATYSLLMDDVKARLIQTETGWEIPPNSSAYDDIVVEQLALCLKAMHMLKDDISAETASNLLAVLNPFLTSVSKGAFNSPWHAETKDAWRDAVTLLKQVVPDFTLTTEI